VDFGNNALCYDPLLEECCAGDMGAEVCAGDRVCCKSGNNKEANCYDPSLQKCCTATRNNDVCDNIFETCCTGNKGLTTSCYNPENAICCNEVDIIKGVVLCDITQKCCYNDMDLPVSYKTDVKCIPWDSICCATYNDIQSCPFSKNAINQQCCRSKSMTSMACCPVSNQCATDMQVSYYKDDGTLVEYWIPENEVVCLPNVV
jgi:hypothetical protein